MDLEGTNAFDSMKKGWGSSSTEHLLSVVSQLAPQFRMKQDDLDFLGHFLRSRDFQHLMNIHDRLRDIPCKDAPCQPLTLLYMIMYDLEESTSKDCEELYRYLNSTNVHSAIMAYDKIVNKDYLPIPINPEELKKQEDADPIMTVRVEKGNEPLGITVKSDTADNILISRVIHGTVADRCGLFRVGDVIHEINGYSVHGKTIDEIAEEMSKLSGTVTFKISSSQECIQPQIRHQPQMYMKALFSYNPVTDFDLPCTEAGLTFRKGDILVVLNRDDPHWWQAKQINNTIVGLIPSSRMRERSEYNSSLMQCSTNRRRKAKEVEYSPLDCEEQGGQELAIYEEVVKIEPQTLHPRPIVLIAPNCAPFSMPDLKSKLILSNPSKFGEAILSTTRSPRTNEEDGQHFYFVPKEDFLRSLHSKQLIEYVEFEGDYLGLYINTIRNTMVSGRTCVLTLAPKVLKIVHQMAEIKPYVILFVPPRNSQVWIDTGIAQQETFERVQHETEEMEARYGQYFDKKIEYTSLDQVFIGVQRTADELLSKPQWVPATWSA